MRRQPSLPEYAVCAREGCGEYASAALRLVDGQIICANCATTTHQRGRCPLCWRGPWAPVEVHHVAAARQCPTLTITVCLNCHAVLSQRQYRWHPSWRTESHSLRCLVQGLYDVVLLFFERSSAAEQCRALLALVGQAALYVMGHLRLEALAELGQLVDWSVI